MFRSPLWSMSRKLTVGLGVAVLAVLAVSGTDRARASIYNYDILAQAGDTIGGFGVGNIGDVALNNSGGAAFIGGTFGTGLFTPTSLLAKAGDTIGGATFGGIKTTDINDSGGVVFSASMGGGSVGIFTPSSKIAVPGDTIGGNTLTQIVSNTNINNAGTITFMGRHKPGGVLTPGIYTQSSLIYEQPGMPGDRHSLNNSGVVAFEAGHIFTHDGLSLSTVGTFGDVIDGIRYGGGFADAGPAIGDGGLVAWVGNGVDNATNTLIGNTLFTPTRIVAKKGDIIDGVEISNLLFGTGAVDISVNGSGKVAYRARIDGPSKTGVFVEQSKVAAQGDTILGKSVGAVGRLDMNNLGQVLFEAKLDGVSSLVLATPVASGGYIFNGDFELAALDGWTATGAGSAAAIEFPAGSGNLVAELTAGSEEVLSQNIDTPSSPYWLSYDYLFPSTDGLLKVLLNSEWIDLIAAPSSLESDFITRSLLIDAPALRGLSDVELAFSFNGPHGSKVLLDNVSINAVPEPTTFVIWSLFGALGISVGWRQRKRRAALGGASRSGCA